MQTAQGGWLLFFLLVVLDSIYISPCVFLRLLQVQRYNNRARLSEMPQRKRPFKRAKGGGKNTYMSAFILCFIFFFFVAFIYTHESLHTPLKFTLQAFTIFHRCFIYIYFFFLYIFFPMVLIDAFFLGYTTNSLIFH